jgi:hypothetical protein
MAELEIDGDELVVRLSTFEAVEGLHAGPRVPLSQVTALEVVEDAHAAASHGIKIGTRLPGISEVGSFISRDDRTFAVVHHDTPRGVRVLIDAADGEYDDWIMGSAEPETVVAELRQRLV